MEVYKFNKNLTIDNLKENKNKITNLIEKEDKIVLDFSKTKNVDFFSLGMLVHIYKESINSDIEIN